MSYRSNEKWLPIKNYEGLYEISDMGRFRTYYGRCGRKINKYTRLILPYINKDGYRRIMLYAKHKKIKPINKAVCRTVLESFVGDCPAGMEASHLDGVRSNDKLKNLKWETHLENEQRKDEHGTRPVRTNTKLTEDEVKEIRKLCNEATRKYGSHARIAKMFNVHPDTIGGIADHTTWKSVL
jgi:hypothetical protein